MRWRSPLFVPANRPDLAAKVPAIGPDLVVLDLEDAVPPPQKASARLDARRCAADLVGAGLAVALRVNAPATEWFDEDVDLASSGLFEALVVPKLEYATTLEVLRHAVGTSVIAGLETVRGVEDVRSLLVGPVAACYFGAEDYVADLGGARTTMNLEVQHARARVAVAARLAGTPALDMVTLDFHDAERFRREAAEAVALGYVGKLCIHPSQVDLANVAFVPLAEDVRRARDVLVAYDAAVASGRATTSVDGAMVDDVVARLARATLQRAGVG